MQLARVVGPVVMTIKHPVFVGETVLLVQPLDEAQQPLGTAVVAIDRAQAGPGDVVLVLREGSGIRQIMLRDKGIAVAEAVKADHPVQALIVAVVDQITIDQVSVSTIITGINGGT
jgi:microcompartment protein CcmK/EutM